MRFNPMYKVSTTLFVLSFVVSCIGGYIDRQCVDGLYASSSIGALIWSFGVLLLIAGWIVHMIGYFREHND